MNKESPSSFNNLNKNPNIVDIRQNPNNIEVRQSMSNQFEEFFNNIPKNQPYSDNQIINNLNNNQNSGNYEFKKFSHNNFDINNNLNLNKNNINNKIDEEMKVQDEPYGSSYDEGSCSSCKSNNMYDNQWRS